MCSINPGLGNEETKYKFSRKELDVETNLSYFGARYYDGEIARWWSVDPVPNPESGLTPYHYVRNNPINSIDPDGRDPRDAQPDKKKHKKKKGFWDKLVDFVKTFFPMPPGIFNPNQPPPDIVDTRESTKEVTESVAGKNEDIKNASQLFLQGNDNTEFPRPDPAKLIFTPHAKQRMKERNISEESVTEAVTKGKQRPGNKPNTMVYDLPANESSTGRGVRVVVDKEKNTVITVIDKGSKYQ
ncbi:MAG: DUF4258 domain-containing protein [Bacteroidetes bacterium]|nr:MAG: DUF4258 domain-containing protein [Bacteroidota bacterium]